ncbi:Leucine-rich repeat receptor-like protein FASCIATED EAR2, partial [Mucuna pruriens]
MVSFMEGRFYLRGTVTKLNLLFSYFTPVVDLNYLADSMPTMRLYNIPAALGEGEIPKCIGSLAQLVDLKLARNALVGSIPHTLANLSNLQNLDLSLSGVIPKSIGTLPQIESLHLNNNNFSGEIPSLNLCRSLRFIDFGDNILEGTLPTLLDLDDLIVLHLQGNKIQGSIPTSLCNLLSLQVLDLSSNNIIGKIPQCLSDISALSDVNSQRGTIFYGTSAPFIFHDSGIGFFVDETILTWKGYKMEFGVNLGFITTIDLSDNHLTGEIPQILTTLVALVSLNLSGNNLTGFIPNNIGDMQRLESVDLSRNHLYGKIPQSFSNLIILGTMNLSFNNLSGEIPISTHLQTFDASSYVGNIGLCGPPLTNQCPADVIPPFGRVHKNGTNELKTFGFYVSLGFGFCVGFWSVCGTLIIKSSWRHAYFRFFNNINAWIFVTVVVFTAKLKRRFEIQTKR